MVNLNLLLNLNRFLPAKQQLQFLADLPCLQKKILINNIKTYKKKLKKRKLVSSKGLKKLISSSRLKKCVRALALVTAFGLVIILPLPAFARDRHANYLFPGSSPIIKEIVRSSPWLALLDISHLTVMVSEYLYFYTDYLGPRGSKVADYVIFTGGVAFNAFYEYARPKVLNKVIAQHFANIYEKSLASQVVPPPDAEAVVNTKIPPSG